MTGNYDTAIDEAAAIIEKYLREHPEHQHLTQGKYDVTPPGDTVECLVEIEPSLYNAIKRTDIPAGVKMVALHLSGFQWDCALTFARERLNLGPTPMCSVATIPSRE